MIWLRLALPAAAAPPRPRVRRAPALAPPRFAPRARPATPASRGALALVLISTALKLLVVLAPSVHLSPAWVLAEELHRGNIALELLQGPLLPLQDYHHAPNVGGSVVVGVLAVPFVALLGPSILAVRLVPILFNALAVALVFLILDRTYGRRAAWVGGALMAVAAPGYTLLSVTAWGTHHEGNALSLACVLLALGLRSRAGAVAPREEPARERAGLWRAGSLGLVAGFAVYFGYMSLLVLACLVAFALLHDKLVFLRPRFWAAAAGALVGFLPWITFNTAHEFRGLSIYGAPLQDRLRSGGPLVLLGHLKQLLVEHVPASFYVRGLSGVPDRAGEWAIYLGFVVLVAAAVVGLRRPTIEALRSLTRVRVPRPLAAGLLFLAYLPVFVIAITCFDVGQWEGPWTLAHDGRYIAPLYPFAALLAAVGFETLARRGAFARGVATAATAGVLLVSAAGTIAVCDFDRFGAPLRQPGTSTAELARFLTWKYRTDLPRLERIVTGLEERRPRAVQEQVLFGLSQGLRASVLAAEKGEPAIARELWRFDSALAFLHGRVASDFRPLFERPVEGDRVYAWADRASFWSDHRARQRLAPEKTALGSGASAGR